MPQISGGSLTLRLRETLDIIHRVDHVEVLVFVRVEDSHRFSCAVFVVLDVDQACRLLVLCWFEQHDVFPKKIQLNSGNPSKTFRVPHRYFFASTRSSSSVPWVRAFLSVLM